MKLNQQNNPIIEFDDEELKYIKRSIALLCSSCNRLQANENKKDVADYDILHVNQVDADLSNIVTISLNILEMFSYAQLLLSQHLNNRDL